MKLQVTLVKSPVSSKPNHIKVVKALGLHNSRRSTSESRQPSHRDMEAAVSRQVRLGM